MNFWGDMLGGFLGRKREIEQHNLRQSDLAAQRESQIFGTLLQSDDPEIAKMALAGLLHSSDPRQKAKGLKGWVGETLASPYMGKIDALLKTPVTETQTEQRQTLPSMQASPTGALAPAVQPTTLETPDPNAPAAMSSTSPVQPGAQQPPAPLSWTAAPPTPYTLSRTIQRPRQAFLSPVEKYSAEQVAKNRADIEGDAAAYMALGMSRQEALQQVLQERLRRGGGAGLGRSIAGEAPDGQGGWAPVFGVFEPRLDQYVHPGTTTPIAGFRPRTTTASSSMGVAVEPLARALYGKRGAELGQAEMANVLELGKLQKSELTVKDAIGIAQRFLPNASIDQQLQLADALKSGAASPVAPGGAGATGAPGAPPTPAAAPAAGAPSSSAAPPPAVGAQTPAPAAAPPAAAPPAPSTPTAAPFKKPGIAASVPSALATGSKETGKPMPPAVATALAKAKSTNDLIDQAMTAMAPFKNDTSLQGSIKMVSGYRMGNADNPVANAATALDDLATLQQSASAALTGGTSRARQFQIDRRQHMPRLPSGFQTMMPFSAETVQKGSILLKGLHGEEGGFDSPALMYQKLEQAKKLNENFVRELESAVREPMLATGHTPGGAGAAGAVPPAVGAAPGTAYKDENGVWRIRQ